MQITVKFTEVYDGEEPSPHRETFDVPEPVADLDDWAYVYIFPRTGDGAHPSGDAGYFVEVVACDQHPELVGREFEWGV